ncbi:MAG: glycosyltransferase family 39 protein [Nanoarchaeota archaeon]|nr:glycosyltransferase family 39 protein [Nanoarchaeota archaeon]MBU1135686.1 glycosyltransferase family 39 protein [Nanoarchaeota archaeon]MBU2520560.1 glycosyltransferase family 39 protein [Nanoarchaeota archaeon]
MNSEQISMVVVLMIIVALWLPTIGYTETDDSVVYAELAQSFASGEGYYANGEPHAHHLPLFPIIAAPLTYIASPMFALRLASLLLGIFSLVAWFYLRKEIFPKEKGPYFLLLFLSPMLVLFTFFRGLAESPMILFSLLSVLFILRAERTSNKYYYYLSGISFGLAALSRYAGVVLGVVYILWFFTERKRYNKHFIASMAIGFFIFSLLLIENFLVFGNPIQFLSTFGEVTSSSLPLLFKMPLHFFIFLPAILIMSGILLIPFVIKGIERDKSLFIMLVVFGLLFASLGNLRFRYVVPIIPFVLILAYNGYTKIKGNWRHLIVLGILLNILITPYFVSGEFKDFADNIYQTPTQWGQAGLRGQEANNWINNNVPEGSIIATRHADIWSSYFRDDIKLVQLGEDSDYIIYDQVLPDSDYYVPSGSEEVFSTSYPITTIYRIK